MIINLKGRLRKLMLPNGEEHKAVYAIVDLNDLKASHNEITFADTIGYPTENGRNINDRNYKDDISAQRNVQKIAENLNPETLISLSSTPSGTPIINKDGFVVSGNNRVMSLKLATKQYPKNYEKYKEQLNEDLGVFGFAISNLDSIKFDKPFTNYIEKAQKLVDSNKLYIQYDKVTSGASKGDYLAIIGNPVNAEVDLTNIEWYEKHARGTTKEKAKQRLPKKLAEYFKRMDESDYLVKYPVLVRIDESLPEKLNTEVLAAFNQDTKKGERPVDKAIKLSSILNSNERCKNAIIHIIDGYDTFSDLYSPNGRNDRKKLAENFVQCGLIPEAQLPIYFDAGEFTENGKDYIETLLSAIILDADALKVLGVEGVKRYRQTLISSLPVLIANETLKEGSLKKDISDAIVIQYKIVQSGGSLSDYTHSQSLFSEDKPSEKGLYINSLLRVGKNTFKAAIKKYTDAAKSNEGVSLFGENMSIDEIFDKTIKAVVDESDRKNIEQLFKNEDKIVNKAFGNMRTFEDTKEAKSYQDFYNDIMSDYKKNRPNSGVPSNSVISTLYDDYLKDTTKEERQLETKQKTTPFREVEKGDYVKVYSGDNVIDEGLITFKYGNHYLNLDNDSNRKYSYGNGYIVIGNKMETENKNTQPKESIYSSFDDEYLEQIVSNIKDEIPANWQGDDSRERLVKNAIWKEIGKINLKQENKNNLLDAVYTNLYERKYDILFGWVEPNKNNNIKYGDTVIGRVGHYKNRVGTVAFVSNDGNRIVVELENGNDTGDVGAEEWEKLVKQTVNGVDAKVLSEEHINPNTDEEFYEELFKQIDPKDEWQGNLMKERDIKQQLNSIVNNATPEDIEELFLNYWAWFNLNKKEEVAEQKKVELKYYKGLDFAYKNPYEYNRAVEELLDSKNERFTAEEKVFMSNYSGYGGLEKFGAEGKGLLYEYYTPRLIVEKMWGLAYKYGFNGGNVLEPSCGVGEFIKFAPNKELVTGYEINLYSAKIAAILYPDAQIIKEAFETIFIKNRASIKNKLGGVKKYNLVIGNPPYGEFGGLYAGMGEKGYTKAENYIDYFISRGLDLLESNGLLIMIVGAEVAAGGKPFLSKGTSKAKQDIMEKSILVDAYRLPNGVFDRTDVLSDIIVLRKK